MILRVISIQNDSMIPFGGVVLVRDHQTMGTGPRAISCSYSVQKHYVCVGKRQGLNFYLSVGRMGLALPDAEHLQVLPSLMAGRDSWCLAGQCPKSLAWSTTLERREDGDTMKSFGLLV